MSQTITKATFELSGWSPDTRPDDGDRVILEHKDGELHLAVYRQRREGGVFNVAGISDWRGVVWANDVNWWVHQDDLQLGVPDE